MSFPATFALEVSSFGPVEREVLRYGRLTAHAFTYPSGVAALRIRNGAGEIVVLPFRGQQVWDAHFLARRLTMGSPFEAPRATADYLSSYGAFFIHCGLTAMGNPGPEDSHPLHGELPTAALDEAALAVGEDDLGPYLEVRGCTRQTRAFFHDFEARLSLRLRAEATVFESLIEVTNLAARPLDLMYLAHVNFRPSAGGEIIDTAPDADLFLRPRPNDHQPPDGSFRARVLAELPAHRRIPADEPVDPEIVLAFPMEADAEGWAHAIQVHPDGSADWVSHRPDQLAKSVRWFVRDGDMDALGFSLPATGAPDGRAAAHARGETVKLGPGQTWQATVRAGALSPANAAALRSRVEAIRSSFGRPQ